MKRLKRWMLERSPFPYRPSHPHYASEWTRTLVEDWAHAIGQVQRESREKDHANALAENERRSVAASDGITRPLIEGAL